MQPDSNRNDRAPIHRRVFIGKVAARAAYVAPAVLALRAAEKTYAGPSGCGQTGSPCADNPDCCVGWTCQQPNTTPCAGMMNCTCQ